MHACRSRSSDSTAAEPIELAPVRTAWRPARTGREQAMVAQHEEVFVTQIANQLRLLLLIERKPLVIMVSEAGQNERRMLRDGQDAILLRRHGDAVAAVEMEDTLRIFARRVDRTLDRESGGVDVVGAVDVRPSMSTFTRLEAVISSNRRPYGLIRK
jgi:hypothetical protein